MEQYYSDERNVQILVYLLKAHGIKRIVVSPGSTNVTFVGSVQQDPYFTLYSCVDERSAAYMACGLCAETCEPVALSCTGATASRNYFSALTEAYYRKLPILAITSTQDRSRIGHLIPQAIDRSSQPYDTVKLSVYLQNCKDKQDEWDCMIKANQAILELNHHGSGPVHVNLATTYCPTFKTKELAAVNVIKRFTFEDQLPDLPQGKIAIYVGTHNRWETNLAKAVDLFCEKHNAVVFHDPASNYNGKYGVCYELAAQQSVSDPNKEPDLLIHIGNMSDMCGVLKPKNVWRVSEDGIIADRYQKLRKVFEMKEESFFSYYAEKEGLEGRGYFENCKKREREILNKVPELPFSHLWISQRLHDKFPDNSCVHYGILSPLRSWGYFPKKDKIETYCNQGGFGIDGNMSTLIGASFANPDKLYFGIFGDLSFFYDINSLGNRHIRNNIRILLINNSLGAEFHLFKQLNSIYVNSVEQYLSAGGHFGHQSPTLVRDFAKSLGFEYLTASGKDDFMAIYERFVTPTTSEKPIIFEVFTKVADENDALYAIYNIEKSLKSELRGIASNIKHGGGIMTLHEQKYQISQENLNKD